MFRARELILPDYASASTAGHAAHPDWPGSFTGGVDGTGPVVPSGSTVEWTDFTGGVLVGTTGTPAGNVTFRGCRFQFSANISNQGNNSAAQVFMFATGLVTFEYCTFQPFVSNYPTRLTGDEDPGDTSTFVEYGQAYQYAINGGGGFNTFVSGGMIVDHCDFWGFGNALELAGSTVANPHIVRDSWFHHGGDPFIENVTANQFHNDCWLVNDGNYRGAQSLRNTMEIWGNTNCLAWQGAGDYDDAVVVGNLFGGDQETVVISASGTSSRVTFTDNWFSTRIGRAVGTGRPLRSWSVDDDGAGSLWARNKYLVAPDSDPVNYPAARWGDPADNGLFWWPGDADATGGHATDYEAA